MSYKDKGWGTDYIDNQRRAELLLQQLLSDHPQSDKISDAAYQLGDLYESKAFKQYDRAAHYFERCFEWNPKTQFDARLRAARLRLHQPLAAAFSAAAGPGAKTARRPSAPVGHDDTHRFMSGILPRL